MVHMVHQLVCPQILLQFPVMLNTHTPPHPEGLASESEKNEEIPLERHKTKSSAKVAGKGHFFSEDSGSPKT